MASCGDAFLAEELDPRSFDHDVVSSALGAVENLRGVGGGDVAAREGSQRRESYAESDGAGVVRRGIECGFRTEEICGIDCFRRWSGDDAVVFRFGIVERSSRCVRCSMFMFAGVFVLFCFSSVDLSSILKPCHWPCCNEIEAMALEYVLHALDILKENDSMCPKNGNIPNSSEDEFSSEREYKPVDSSARLHYLAGRLLLGQDSPKEALSYLKMADSLTKKWPSLNIAVQRTLVACVDRCRRDGVVSERPSSKDASVEMLLRPEMCKLLSTFEKSLAQRDVWEVGYAPRTLTASKEVIWTDDESGEAKPPFEFTVSFSQSTHATASGKVAACVSIESCLGFPVFVSSIQLMTTSGYYDVTNLDQCLDCSTLQSKDRMENLKSRTMYSPRQGVLFHPKEVVFFLTELTLPSDLSSIAPGGSVVDLTKFVPKNGKLCNMGYSYAGKNRLRCFITTLWRIIFLTSIQILTQLSRQHLQFEV